MNLTVLLVEDNAQLALSVRQRFSCAQVRVFHAADGATAIQLAGEASPDVVILDIGLPDMEGFDVCRQIRGRADIRQPRIIFFSAHTQASFRKAVKDAGGDAFLPKTCGATGLLKEILALARTGVIGQPASALTAASETSTLDAQPAGTN